MKFLKFIVILAIFSRQFSLHGSCSEHSCEEMEELHWSKEKTQAANIQVEIASPGVIQNFIEVPGKIVVHPDCIAYVIPKVSGSVKEIRKTIGECVKKDEVLAVLESKEMAEAKSNYLASIKKMDLRHTLLQREVDLKGISPEQDYLHAKLAEEEARINVDLSKQSLYAIGLTEAHVEKINREKSTDLRLYEITSPIDGKVLQRNLTLGELISNTNKVYTIVGCNKVWTELSVSQNNLPYLKVGLPIEIISANGKRETTKILQFNPLISEETRTATAFAVIEDNTEKWSPGEFVTIKVQTNMISCAIVIPKTAVQNIKGENNVFVEKGENYIPRIVTIGRKDEKNVEVLEGLQQGEKYAGSNTFVLKAEYEKEEAEHNHP